MFKVLTLVVLIFQVYFPSLLLANSKVDRVDEIIDIQTFSREEVLPLLPLLHGWLAKHLSGFPYYYVPPKEQIIHPYDTVYVNEKEAIIVIAKLNNEIIGIAAGVSLDSFYLDYNLGNVFSSDLIDQFKKKGFHPSEVLYMGYFLMAENYKNDAKAVLRIFDQIINAAKKWDKKKICYIQVLCDESRLKDFPEPYGTIISGFKDSGIEMSNLSWPTAQTDGSMQMQSHDMTFYLMDLN